MAVVAAGVGLNVTLDLGWSSSNTLLSIPLGCDKRDIELFVE